MAETPSDYTRRKLGGVNRAYGNVKSGDIKTGSYSPTGDVSYNKNVGYSKTPIPENPQLVKQEIKDNYVYLPDGKIYTPEQYKKLQEEIKAKREAVVLREKQNIQIISQQELNKRRSEEEKQEIKKEWEEAFKDAKQRVENRKNQKYSLTLNYNQKVSEQLKFSSNSYEERANQQNYLTGNKFQEDLNEFNYINQEIEKSNPKKPDISFIPNYNQQISKQNKFSANYKNIAGETNYLTGNPYYKDFEQSNYNRMEEERANKEKLARILNGSLEQSRNYPIARIKQKIAETFTLNKYGSLKELNEYQIKPVIETSRQAREQQFNLIFNDKVDNAYNSAFVGTKFNYYVLKGALKQVYVYPELIPITYGVGAVFGATASGLASIGGKTATAVNIFNSVALGGYVGVKTAEASGLSLNQNYQLNYERPKDYIKSFGMAGGSVVADLIPLSAGSLKGTNFITQNLKLKPYNSILTKEGRAENLLIDFNKDIEALKFSYRITPETVTRIAKYTKPSLRTTKDTFLKTYQSNYIEYDNVIFRYSVYTGNSQIKVIAPKSKFKGTGFIRENEINVLKFSKGKYDIKIKSEGNKNTLGVYEKGKLIKSDTFIEDNSITMEAQKVIKLNPELNINNKIPEKPTLTFKQEQINLIKGSSKDYNIFGKTQNLNEYYIAVNKPQSQTNLKGYRLNKKFIPTEINTNLIETKLKPVYKKVNPKTDLIELTEKEASILFNSKSLILINQDSNTIIDVIPKGGKNYFEIIKINPSSKNTPSPQTPTTQNKNINVKEINNLPKEKNFIKKIIGSKKNILGSISKSQTKTITKEVNIPVLNNQQPDIKSVQINKVKINPDTKNKIIPITNIKINQETQNEFNTLTIPATTEKQILKNNLRFNQLKPKVILEKNINENKNNVIKQQPIIISSGKYEQKNNIVIKQIDLQTPREETILSQIKIPTTTPTENQNNFNPIPAIKIIPEEIRQPYIKKFKSSKIENNFNNGFDVLIKRQGKFIKITSNPLSKQQAINYGTYTVGNTASATFKIQKSNKNILGSFFGKGNINDFYIKDGLFIEKKEKRINTIGELKEITLKGLNFKKFITGR